MKYIAVIKFIAALVLCFGASAVGALFMDSDTLTSWYAQLQKPSITPPGWVFGPVWTLLYFMMSVSLFLVWKKGLGDPGIKAAVCVFLLQLALNAAWTPLFFGFHMIFAALVVIVFLFLAILAAIIFFKKISFLAAMLLVPYLIWVGYASVLNALIWHLNR
ncbi:MAG: tryptophan-rich sensory protein [Phycisphaerae bacterium]|nr:tryptophan-rich sensory protein [Phycisphaerae bacterium]